MIKNTSKLQKFTFAIAILMIFLTMKITEIPNPNQLEEMDTIKAFLGMTTAISSLIFMTISVYNPKNKVDVNEETTNIKKKIIEITLLIGIFVSSAFFMLFIFYHFK